MKSFSSLAALCALLSMQNICTAAAKKKNEEDRIAAKTAIKEKRLRSEREEDRLHLRSDHLGDGDSILRMYHEDEVSIIADEDTSTATDFSLHTSDEDIDEDDEDD